MTESIFSFLPKQTQTELMQICEAVDGVLPIEAREWEIDVATLPENPKDFEPVQEISGWVGKSTPCLYLFKYSTTNVDATNVGLCFEKSKKEKVNGRAYARFNASLGACLYVGSSQSMCTRFKEHLGYGSASTYALQLIHWARPLGLHLQFVCAKYAKDTPAEVLQALEDTLWQNQKPMFGRLGRK